MNKKNYKSVLYPDNIGYKLGFEEVKELIKLECLSSMGVSLVDNIQFITNYDLLLKLLTQTLEFKTILEHDTPFPNQNYIDTDNIVRKCKVEGTFLSEEEFFQLTLSLSTIFSVISYLKDRSEIYPNLYTLIEDVNTEQSILREIAKVIDSKGKIRTDASPKLISLVRQIIQAESTSRQRLDFILKNAIKEGWSSDNNLTIRDGRLVIPISAEHKRKIKGIVLDESATGQTVYIEPYDVFELNNTIRDLEFEKRREIVRLLTELTNIVRPYIPLIQQYRSILAKIDFISAKAKFAFKIDASMPILNKEPYFKIVNARHPILYLSLKKNNQSVVPLNITTSENSKIIVVSGPNAGGKSVCLKTVGLLQLMLQSGILVPVDNYSEMGIFKKILVDIGDDQSIESDLSTYSAHLTKMREFVDRANFYTLVLIDEFGTGTDPQFGGPISEAVLQVLNQKQVKGVITTHYSNLKVFAGNTVGIENASMLFDNIKMQPLYVLQIGKPGSSYALEIANKIGLQDSVLELAKQKIGGQQKKVETLLVDLEREKKTIYDTKKDLDKKLQKLKELQKENEQLKAYFEENKRKLISSAKEEAKQIVLSANKLIENAISDIRSNNAEKSKTSEIRKKISQEQERIAKEEKEAIIKKQISEEIVNVGDWVKINDSEAIGIVTDINKDKIFVQIGELITIIKRSKVVKTAKKDNFKPEKSTYASFKLEQQSSFSTDIDVRGMRGEEALGEVERFLDNATMSGLSTIRILHGRGDGILRKLIRTYIKKYVSVKSVSDEHPDRGGDGITIVNLN